VELEVTAFHGAQTSERLVAITRNVNQARYDLDHTKIAHEKYLTSLSAEHVRFDLRKHFILKFVVRLNL
jgi:hypothetical protein